MVIIMKRDFIYIAVITGLMAMVLVSGCIGEKQSGSILYGKDVFDPQKFSMARYDLSVNEGDNVTHMPFIIIASTGEADGDRLTSIEISSDGPARTDAWISSGRDKTNKVVTYEVQERRIWARDVTPGFNFTTADHAWNSLETQYSLAGSANVSTPAGQYNGCSIYKASKSLGYGTDVMDIEVLYYMHPSSPVPVKYEVNSPLSSVTYTLQSVYGPEDRDSSPERTIETYFECLDKGDFNGAADMLVTEKDSIFTPLSWQDRQRFIANMSQSYGNSAERPLTVYSVYTDSVTYPSEEDRAQAHWVSLQYRYDPLEVYSIDYTSNMAKVKGNWRIII